MERDLNILCLSFWTPPIVRPQSILIGKMLPEWKRQGMNPTVVTYDICGKWNFDAPIYTVPQMKMSKLARKVPFLNRRGVNAYLKKIHDQIKEIVDTHDIDLIFSFSNPQRSNSVGAMLKQSTDLPFVSHFSDPWVGNLYQSSTMSSRAERQAAQGERFVVENSDKIVIVNDVLRDFVMSKYDQDVQDRAITIPHCFDPAVYKEKRSSKSDQFRISYIGAFYKERNPELLLRALEQVLRKREDLCDLIRIEFVGAVNPYANYTEARILDMAKKYGLSSSIVIVPPVPYAKSLEYMVDADLLIAIDADLKGSPFLPSKVVDYAGAGTRIMAITPSGSPTDRFVRNLGYESFSYQDLGAMSDHLEECIDGKVSVSVRPDVLQQYEVSTTTNKYRALFERVLSL